MEAEYHPRFFIGWANPRNWKLRPWLFSTFTPKDKFGRGLKGHATLNLCGVVFAWRVPATWDGRGYSAASRPLLLVDD